MTSAAPQERKWFPDAEAFPVTQAATQPVATTAPAVTLRDRRMYWCIKLADEDVHRLMSPLKELCHASGLTPKDELHCTLWFMGRQRDDAAEAPLIERLGQQVNLTLGQPVYRAEFLMCVPVLIEDPTVAKLCRNAHPHLTLALGKGVAAVKSNELLEEYSNPATTSRVSVVQGEPLRVVGRIEAI